ncbi:MAG TPA: hypothetical protein VFD27_09495 [Chthoniobacteraceae bacterium]|nr:hypothetical protein [Chthoniobacteraceae bacterium]
MTNPRAIIAQVAREYSGTHETSANRGPHFDEFWAATTYPDGATDRQPWCSAFASFCVREADRRSPLLRLPLPPKFPAVAQWLPWARDPAVGCVIFTPDQVSLDRFFPMVGDIVVFLPHLSHVGIVLDDYQGDANVSNVEGNTNAAGSREGDGVFAKTRALSFCGSFIRIPAIGLSVAEGT